MPIYEYLCKNCSHSLELIQKVSDKAETFCPNCQTDGLTKLVSAPQFKLKGTGWYETDFKTKKPQANKEGAASNTAKNSQATTKDNSNNKAEKTANKQDK